MAATGSSHTIVKVCGVTQPQQVSQLAAAGVDWIGINRWPQSRRYVDESSAAAVAAQARASGLTVVGLLVRPDAATIAHAWDNGCYDLLQLYEPPPVPDEVGWIRSVPVSDEALPAPTGDNARYHLWETRVAGYGGRGRRFDWMRLRAARWQRPTLIAGGITPDNVRELLRVVRPFGIDVASGVEVTAGVKDPDKVRKLVGYVRTADAAAHA